MGWRNKLERHGVHVVVVCGQGQGQAVVFPIYAIQGLEKRCAVVVPKLLALQCVLMCVLHWLRRTLPVVRTSLQCALICVIRAYQFWQSDQAIKWALMVRLL